MPNMPPGKKQFGIIVKEEVHELVKELAKTGKYGRGLSDVYATGVVELARSAGVADTAIPETVALDMFKMALESRKSEITTLKSFIAFLQDPNRDSVDAALIQRALAKYDHVQAQIASAAAA